MSFHCTGSGEPFSYEGRHFNARDVIARPTPGAGPDPDLDRRQLQALTRRRVAERGPGLDADGPAAPELSATARTPT